MRRIENYEITFFFNKDSKLFRVSECIRTLIFIYYAFHDRAFSYFLWNRKSMQEIKDSFHVIFIFLLENCIHINFSIHTKYVQKRIRLEISIVIIVPRKREQVTGRGMDLEGVLKLLVKDASFNNFRKLWWAMGQFHPPSRWGCYLLCRRKFIFLWS